MPDKNSEAMLDAILTISIDHGVEPASVVAARNIYSGGSPVQAAVAGGILALGEFHGGAIEQAMENFKKYEPLGVKRLVDEANGSPVKVMNGAPTRNGRAAPAKALAPKTGRAPSRRPPTSRSR